MSHDDFDLEPVAGLPERPPSGETILWQGKPGWRGLAIRVFHVRKVAIYFALLVAWKGITAIWDGEGIVAAGGAMLGILPIALAGLGILAGLAVLYARTTIYTITNKRVALRFGVALPMCINLPFAAVEGAALRNCGKGTGDIPLQLRGPDRIAYMVLWPFARPWHVKRPQPMLRAVPNAEAVAGLLARALKDALGEGVIHSIANDASSSPSATGNRPDLAIAGH